MKTRTTWVVLVSILLGTLLAGLIAVRASVPALAQGPWQSGMLSLMHNNSAVVTLLKLNETELLAQRQAGKSWLNIATAQGVSEQALTDALLEPHTQMHLWIGQSSSLNSTGMIQWMTERIAQDIRVTAYGSMIDWHVLSSGMMGGNTFRGGMMNGNTLPNGMMGGSALPGGMMNGAMMNGWNNAPSTNPAPPPVQGTPGREMQVTAHNFQFAPDKIAVKAGETVKLEFDNQDAFAHNVASAGGQLGYTVLPGNQTTAVVWTAPQQAGMYTVICTFHPGMRVEIEVQ